MSDAPPEELPVGYALWAVFRRHPVDPRTSTHVTGVEEEIREAERVGVVVRGIYDVSGLRADADIMFWLTASGLRPLQQTLNRLRGGVFANYVLAWSAAGVHREAEFSRSHAPAFLRGLPPKAWVTVYPFVRSYDWYLLPEEERRAMLADHGRKGSEYAGVQANTVAAFALGDYEWILALEADDPLELVDLMRHLRNTEARRHVREETPFFTGRRIEPAEIAAVLS